jgi:protein involved in polysaccharide export with SLBB domain
MARAPRDGARSPVAVPLILVVFLVLSGLTGGCGSSKPPAPPPPYTTATADSTKIPPETEAYRVLVYDELNLLVLGSPELSGTVRVLPDGTITIPGVGARYVLGLTIPEVTDTLRQEIAKVVRYPQVSVSVSNFGERRVYVMGEVNLPGDQQYHSGLSALGAISMAGGFNNAAKRSSVVILRRTGPDQAIAFRTDLTQPLSGQNVAFDVPIKPFDIIYVPKTFIASVNVMMDQYFRQLTPPFTLYIDGWTAFHLNDTNVRIVR